MNRLKFYLEPVNQRQRNWGKLWMLTIWWRLGVLTYFRAIAGVKLPAKPAAPPAPNA